MPRRLQDDSGVFFGGLLTGLGIGALFGMIFAPRPGRETRQRLADAAADWPDAIVSVAKQAQVVAGDVVKSTSDLLEQTGERISEAARKGVEEARAYAGDAKDGRGVDGSVQPASANKGDATQRDGKSDSSATGSQSGPRPVTGLQGGGRS